MRVSRAVFDTLKMLTPYDINIPKVRYGNERDGCYVLADLPGLSDVISFGVNDDVGFETDMARLGRRVFLFDHTIPGLPANHPLFSFHQLGICGVGQTSRELLTLRNHLDRLGELSGHLLLKVDVEGHEWATFATVDAETLSHFDQIVVELHWMDNLRDAAFRTVAQAALRNINDQFTLFHVHANNGRPLTIVDGFMVADVIEVSYVRTSLVTRRRSTTVYPSSINRANNPVDDDLPLLFFPFLPTSVDADRIEDVVKRIELEAAVRG